MSGGALDRARAAWGNGMPDWVAALAGHADAHSQAAAAKAISYSTTVVSLVLNARYTGDLSAVETRVRGVLMGTTVTCPVLGDIPWTRCRDTAGGPMPTGNRRAYRLWQACQGCPNNHP